MNDKTNKPDNQLLGCLYEEFHNLKNKLISISTEINNASWERNMSGSKHADRASFEKNVSDISLSLIKILCKEKDSRTLQPFILSIISEDEKIFHPLRTEKFQLIHTETMSVRTEKAIHSQQRVAIFTIPMLYTKFKVYRLTKEDQEEMERKDKSLYNSITPIMKEHNIPLTVPINLNESKEIFVTYQAQGRAVPEMYEFTYASPFEEETNKLLNLREWLDQQVICVNKRTFTIEDIIKEVRNKVAAHQSVTSEISKESFLYNTKFINFGSPYWAYFIYFCALYVMFIVGENLNKKDGANLEIIDPFKSDAIINSVRPSMFSHEAFSHEGLESFLVWSNNVSFAANTKLDLGFIRIPLLRIIFSNDNETEHKSFDIPIMVLGSLFAKIKEGESIALYLHLKENMCGFGLKFKSGADFVIYFIKDKDNTISQIDLKSYINLPVTRIQILAHNPFKIR